MHCYKIFASFFDKVIEDYHGHKPTDKHVSEMTTNNLKCPPLPADECAMIKSTRIRVGRNLASCPLPPGMKLQNRLDVEKKMK